MSSKHRNTLRLLVEREHLWARDQPNTRFLEQCVSMDNWFNTSLTLLLEAISPTVSKNQFFQSENAVVSRLLYGLQKTYCTNHRYLRIMCSTLGMMSLMPSCTSSNEHKRAVWLRSRQRLQCCHQLSIKEICFSDAHVFVKRSSC
jgi:hypothetical protein